MVLKVAQTPYPAFEIDLSDPLNTKDSGKHCEEVTLVVHTGYPNNKGPYAIDTKAGTLTVLLTDPSQIGVIKPGQFMDLGFLEVQD
jgi:hypothetical protein